MGNYTPDLRINLEYLSNMDSVGLIDDSDHNMDDDEEPIHKTCTSYMIPFMYYFINGFSVIVTVCCYIGGLIAPFVIFFCW